MQVLLVRHGDPDYEKDTLTDKGLAEARALAGSLRNVPIDAIYVSPMGRARRTMEYTAGIKGIEAMTLDWLHELDGHFGNGRWCWNVLGAEALDRTALPTMDDWHADVPYGELMLPPVANHRDRVRQPAGRLRLRTGGTPLSRRATRRQDHRLLRPRGSYPDAAQLPPQLAAAARLLTPRLRPDRSHTPDLGGAGRLRRAEGEGD